MTSFFSTGAPRRVLIALTLLTISAGVWIRRVYAQTPTQIGVSTPLPVFVTNAITVVGLPEGFVQGSHWKFTTWTVPSTFSWMATVNKTSGDWANLTIVASDRGTNTQWYYVPAMPGSWEKQ